MLRGETAMLHLDDWEYCDQFYNDPIGKQNFTWGSPKSKNVDYKVKHPIFSQIVKETSNFIYRSISRAKKYGTMKLSSKVVRLYRGK